MRLKKNSFESLSLVLVIGLMMAVLPDPALADVPNFAARPQENITPERPHPQIPEEETLLYDVRWFGVPVARGRIAVAGARMHQDRKVYQLEAGVSSHPFLSKFYPVRDELRSLYDAEGGFTWWFEKNLREGRYRAHEVTRFDYPNQKAHWKSHTNGNAQEMDLRGRVHDVLTAFYWFRTQDAGPGERVKARVHADEKDWELEIHVLRYETLELRNVGVFDAIVIEPRASFKGVLVDRGRTWVYLSADAKRTPLKFRIETPYGPFVGVMAPDSTQTLQARDG